MRKVSYSEAIKKKCPEPIAMAVSWDKKNNRANIIALGWFMCTSIQPPMFAISVGHSRHSCQTIREIGEFVLSFPNEDQSEAMLFCGTQSGRDRDKFKESGFKPLPAVKVKPPLIADACANFECKVTASCVSGDHMIFVGEVVASHVEDSDKAWLFTMENGSFKGIKG